LPGAFCGERVARIGTLLKGWKGVRREVSVAARSGSLPDECARRGGDTGLDWTRLVFDLIDMRSFSNLWYWIALAVTWSSASHWVLGVPWDMALRARRLGGEAERDFEDVVRANVNRLLNLADLAGVALMAVGSFGLATLAMLGFLYGIEFCQAVFLLALPLAVVGLLSVRTARRIRVSGESGDALRGRMARHRIAIQAIGMLSIFVTAFWGMLQNFNISILG
jgi:hypothetical protein